MGGSVERAINQMGRNIKHIVGEKAYNVGKQLTGLGQMQTYTNLLQGKSIRESLSENLSVGFRDDLLDKPEVDTSNPNKPSVVDTAALAAALEEEEQNRKKKKGFAANVFGSDFRFGGVSGGVTKTSGGSTGRTGL